MNLNSEEIGEFLANSGSEYSSSNHDSDVSSNEDIVENESSSEKEDETDEEWREWDEDDESFCEYSWRNTTRFKPPRGYKPENELEFFQLFFTDELLGEIIKETNRYAKEKINLSTPLQKKSVWRSWTDVTLPEFKAFLGVVINMGIHIKPEIDDYFVTDWIDNQPFFKSVLSKDRFNQIFWCLHLNPPPTSPILGSLSRSAKVRNVVLYLDKKFREYYVPSNKISIDESTVGFKGKVVFKVYNKDKPTKWGIKVFVASESKTGYICALEPYLGKGTTDNMVRPDLGVTSRVVLQLVQKLKDAYGDIEGMHIFTDRYYTNMDVAHALLEMKVHLTGTIMRNRKGLPEELRPKRNSKKNNEKVNTLQKLKKGEMKCYRKSDKYSLVVWRDKNEVTMLSTLYDNSTEKIRRVKKQGVVEEIVKPSVVCRYNEFMGGVDTSDQYIASYSFTRKSLKWWRKVRKYTVTLIII